MIDQAGECCSSSGCLTRLWDSPPGSAVKPAATLIDFCQSNGLSLICLAEQHLSRLHLIPAASTPCNEESASLDCECDCVCIVSMTLCVYMSLVSDDLPGRVIKE